MLVMGGRVFVPYELARILDGRIKKAFVEVISYRFSLVQIDLVYFSYISTLCYKS